MFSTTIADPEQLSVLTKAFDDYCFAHNIADEVGRDDVARCVIVIFEGGAKTAEEIRAGLERLKAA
jgi:hypothetical protein